MGGEVLALEQELASAAGQRYGIAVASGSAALYLALRALDIGRDCRVVVPSYVCTALLNAVTLCGARPVLCDVDPATGLMRVDDVRKVLTPQVRAVIVPHLFGRPAPAAEIRALGIPVIEDCAQCFGTTVAGVRVGSLGDIAVFSFYATKLISAGEGGMVATSDRTLADRLRSLRDYDNVNTWEPSLNFKLSDLHAAVARVQLRKLDAMIARRRRIAQRYLEGFSGSRLLDLTPSSSSQEHVFFRFVALVGRRAGEFAAAVRECGVHCARPVFKPLHHYIEVGSLPGTDAIYDSAVSIPLYPALSDHDVEKVVACVCRVADCFSRG
jgi:dTDP-4-amino-4,6-dideoxygalactose transaminase